MHRREPSESDAATASTGDADDLPARFGDEPDPVVPIGLERIVQLDAVLTVIFVVSAVFAAIVFTNATRVVAVVIALALFAVGVFAFLMSYFVAVGRSRTEEIAVSELYLLMGTSLPAPPKRALLWLLGVQIVVALGTALARPNTDGKAGSTLAFGVLVPMLGLGLNGLAAARHGTFGPRRRKQRAATAPVDDAPDEDPTVEVESADGVPPATEHLD